MRISLGQLTLFNETAGNAASLTPEQPSAACKKRGNVLSWHKFATLAYRTKYCTLGLTFTLMVSTASSAAFIHLEVPRAVVVACLLPNCTLEHGQMRKHSMLLAMDMLPTHQLFGRVLSD